MFKKSAVLLFVMVFLAFTFSAAFSGERGFARDLGKTAVAVEKGQTSCESMAKCGGESNKMKAVSAQKCNKADCKCAKCVCGDKCACGPGCAMKECGAACAKMSVENKNCKCEKAAVKKYENKNCACGAACVCGSACAMKASGGNKMKTSCGGGACGMKLKSECKSGSCGESKMKAGKMSCNSGKCGK